MLQIYRGEFLLSLLIERIDCFSDYACPSELNSSLSVCLFVGNIHLRAEPEIAVGAPPF